MHISAVLRVTKPSALKRSQSHSFGEDLIWDRELMIPSLPIDKGYPVKRAHWFGPELSLTAVYFSQLEKFSVLRRSAVYGRDL